jgi:hypothetical protein
MVVGRSASARSLTFALLVKYPFAPFSHWSSTRTASDCVVVAQVLYYLITAYHSVFRCASDLACITLLVRPGSGSRWVCCPPAHLSARAGCAVHLQICHWQTG